MWKSPTPFDQALAAVDSFLSSPANVYAMMKQTYRWGGTVRSRAVRHLRLQAAINTIRAMDNKPPVTLEIF
jgi:hypothetical protein